MSVYMSSLVKLALSSNWSEEAVKLLRTAMGGWWSDWLEYADFLAQFSDLSPEQSAAGPARFHSESLTLEQVVDLSVNGDPDETFDGSLLSEREGFDPAVHQALLDAMKAGNLELVFQERILEVEGWVDEDEDEDTEEPVWDGWMDNLVIVQSDGEKFLVTSDMP